MPLDFLDDVPRSDVGASVDGADVVGATVEGAMVGCGAGPDVGVDVKKSSKPTTVFSTRAADSWVRTPKYEDVGARNLISASSVVLRVAWSCVLM